MKLTSFTCLAFLINRVIDAGPDTDLSYEEIFDAAGEGHLISLLAQRCGQNNAFTFVTQAGVNLGQMEASLSDAAAGFEGRVGKPTGPVSGLCLALDIVLEAIQRQFYRSTGPTHGADPAPVHPFLPFVNRPGGGPSQLWKGQPGTCPGGSASEAPGAPDHV
jgi:hypothetical protein